MITDGGTDFRLWRSARKLGYKSAPAVGLILTGAGSALTKPGATLLDKIKIKGGKALIQKGVEKGIDEIND